MSEQAQGGLSVAFAKIVEYSQATGTVDIGQLPGCWEFRVDEMWWVALNGHGERIKSSHDSEQSAGVPPYHAYIEYNGWPAGVINPFEGIMVVGGDDVREEGFIAAMERLIASVK